MNDESMIDLELVICLILVFYFLRYLRQGSKENLSPSTVI